MSNETASVSADSDQVSADSDAAQSSSNISAIASDLAADMPAVQQHAIDLAMQNAGQQAQTPSGNGEAFNPAIHATNPDGSPKMRVDGGFALKRGRKSGAATQSKVAKPQSAATPQVSESEVAARQSGAVMAALCIQLGVVMGGDEWQPRRDDSIGLDEQKQMENAFANYFTAKGYTDIPPGAALAICIGAYALPRFTMPKTRTRLAKVKDWVVAKFVQWRARKNGVKVNVQPSNT